MITLAGAHQQGGVNVRYIATRALMPAVWVIGLASSLGAGERQAPSADAKTLVCADFERTENGADRAGCERRALPERRRLAYHTQRHDGALS